MLSKQRCDQQEVKREKRLDIFQVIQLTFSDKYSVIQAQNKTVCKQMGKYIQQIAL